MKVKLLSQYFQVFRGGSGSGGGNPADPAAPADEASRPIVGGPRDQEFDNLEGVPESSMEDGKVSCVPYVKDSRSHSATVVFLVRIFQGGRDSLLVP